MYQEVQPKPSGVALRSSQCVPQVPVRRASAFNVEAFVIETSNRPNLLLSISCYHLLYEYKNVQHVNVELILKSHRSVASISGEDEKQEQRNEQSGHECGHERDAHQSIRAYSVGETLVAGPGMFIWDGFIEHCINRREALCGIRAHCEPKLQNSETARRLKINSRIYHFSNDSGAMKGRSYIGIPYKWSGNPNHDKSDKKSDE